MAKAHRSKPRPQRNPSATIDRGAAPTIDFEPVMQIAVGPFNYSVELVEGYPKDGQGNPCQGTCNTMSHTIRIARNLPPRKRWSVFWHEFTHAVKTELDVAEASSLGEEFLCNLMALGLSFITPGQFKALHARLMDVRSA